MMNLFIREYAFVDKPVVIADAMKDLKISTKWNFDFFKSECGSIKVIVKQNVNECNSELVFQSFLEQSPIKGYLILLILEFPWLSRFMLAVGLL
ncbi:MAG: hypothetical protein ACYTXA_23775 [Nostoc sp.]